MTSPDTAASPSRGRQLSRRRFLAVGLTAVAAVAGCARPDTVAHAHKRLSGPLAVRADPSDEQPAPSHEVSDEQQPVPSHEASDAAVDPPREWGESVTGVRRRIDTDRPLVALTFDACGGRYGSAYDAALIDTLSRLEVPASLFVNLRWIEANPELFDTLAADPLFDIENHGTHHVPLSVNGRSAYGIAGTSSVDEVVDEVVTCQREIERRTGRAPELFRSGTAHYDEQAVAIVQELGLQVAGFDVLGDAGATYNANEVERALRSATPGSIALLHMNQPRAGTAEGVTAAIPGLRDQGFEFVTLSGRRLV